MVKTKEVKSPAKEMVSKVKRTKNLIEAGQKLRGYRDRIDDIIRIINSGEEFHSDLADECIDIGVTFQSLSSLLRPISIEGKAKARKKKIKARWKSRHKKAQEKGDDAWIAKYSSRNSYSSYGSWYGGPTKAFEEDYCSDL